MSLDVITDEKSFKIHVDEKTNLRNQCRTNENKFCIVYNRQGGGGGGGGVKRV